MDDHPTPRNKSHLRFGAETMKLSLILAAATFSSSSAFAPPSLGRSAASDRAIFVAATPLEEEGESSDPYDRIGVTKDEVAIGVDASEFLQWIGT